MSKSVTGVMKKEEPLISQEEFTESLPPKYRNRVDLMFMDKINELAGSDEYREEYRNNLLSYTGVLNGGRFKINDYVSAVKFVSSRLLGKNNIESYISAHPDRYKRMVNAGQDKDTIYASISAFSRSKLVMLLMEQTLVPTHVLNIDLHQKAINCQAELMTTAKSEKVRCDAANSLLNHLKQPEAQKLTLDVNVKEDDSIKQLREATLELVAQQRVEIQAGRKNIKEVAESRIIKGECVRE